MRKKFTWSAIVLIASLSLLTGCNTKVIEHENQALKTELDNVKKQLNDSRQQTKQVTEEKTKLEKTVESLKSAEVDEQTLPQLAYLMEQQARAAFISTYETSMPLVNGTNGDKIKQVALTQFQHALAPNATQEYIDAETSRLQDAWASKNPIVFPVDKVKQITLKQKDDKQAVVEALVTRSSSAPAPAAAQSQISEDILMTITVEKTELGWKLKSKKTAPAPAAQPATPPTTPPVGQDTNKPS
jgi:regulator of replication initiation timing